MHFFSFRFHDHDICLVKHHKLKMDNNSMLHFALAVKDAEAFNDIRRRARDMACRSVGAHARLRAPWLRGLFAFRTLTTLDRDH